MAALIRDLVLTLTILALIFMAANQNPTSRMVQTDYCVIDMRVAGKHPLTGEWIYGWGQGYGPCNQQDKFFDT